MTSREALAAKALPKSVVIVGAGTDSAWSSPIFYNAFGSKVTLSGNAAQDFAQEDEDVAKTLHRSFRGTSIGLHVGTSGRKISGLERDSVKVDLVAGDKKTEVEAELLLSAIGVVANLREGALAANR